MSNFATIESLAAHLRQELESKKYLLLFAYNGTGKTRLSMAFKEIGKNKPADHLIAEDGSIFITESGDALTVERTADTLYFNAFTEDLFSWDNDLDGDSDRFLKINSKSRFFAGLNELEMDTRIRTFLDRYADFDFKIDTEQWVVRFSREVKVGDDIEVFDNIKVSRGEENLFIWCFFLAIVQLVLDGAEAYKWVKYIYIDDPISSLDENNVVAVGHHLAQLIKKTDNTVKTVMSSHHPLFFNVMSNELGNAKRYFLSNNKNLGSYILRDTSDTPFFYHVAVLVQLYNAAKSGKLYTYHFSMLRIILEKTASFHGFKGFTACIKKDDDDQDGILHTRLVNILNHGSYSLYEPQEMLQENKDFFNKILDDFLNNYNFNTALFLELANESEEAQQA